MGDGSGRHSGHGSGRLSGHRNGRLSGDGSSRGSRRLGGGSQRLLERVWALCPHIAMTCFKTRSTLRCRALKRGTGKMQFALQGHCERMFFFSLGCHVGLVEKYLRKMPQTCILRFRLG